jgi:putative ABC transport system substrate-binding protein
MRAGLVITGILAILVAALDAVAQPAPPRRVGVLVGSTSSPGVLVDPWLAELGYRDGEHVRFERRAAAGRDDRLPDLAADLVRRKMDVIVAIGLPAIRAARKATATIPIVMIAEGDPVQAGLVASIARPGGNVTGVTVLAPELSAKRLELLKEVVPGLRRAAVLWNPDDAEKQAEWKETEVAARRLAVELQSLPVRARADIEPAFEAAAKARSDGMIVLADALVVGQSRAIAALARAKRLPVVFPTSYFVDPGQGGLIAYGPNLIDLSRRAAAYVDRILKGAKPADLPVEQPTRLELTVNLATARALGLTLPPPVLLRADRTIE